MSEKTSAKKTYSLLTLLKKEVKLASSPLSFIFLAFTLMTFIPGYPILAGQFFICLGLFQTFQSGREANDIIYSALLPIPKKDIVKSRYVFVLFIEGLDFFLSLAFTLIRMTLLKDLSPYAENPLLSANFFYLGFSLLILALFNAVFVRGYFRTGYYFAKHFVVFIILSFLVVIAAEALHHVPGLEFISATDFSHMGAQVIFLCSSIIVFCLMTVLSEKAAERSLEKIDL